MIKRKIVEEISEYDEKGVLVRTTTTTTTEEDDGILKDLAREVADILRGGMDFDTYLM